MNKKSIVLVIIVAMLLTISLYFIGGTYARYISEFEGQGTATVAAWKVKVGEKDGTEEKQTAVPVTFTVAENAFVVSEKIAPATKLTGKLAVDLTGSEVAVELSAVINKEALTTALTEYTGLSEDFVVSDPEITKAAESTYPDQKITDGVIKLQDDEAFTEANGKFDITFTIEWKDNTANDKSATKLGIDAQSGSKTITVPVTVTAKQHIQGA